MNPTHQVTLTTTGLDELRKARAESGHRSPIRSRTFEAIRHGGGWEVIFGVNSPDGCAHIEWVADSHVLVVASLEAPPIQGAPPVRRTTQRLQMAA